MFLNCGVGELEIPSDCKEIKPVNPQGNQSWIFIGKTDVEAENSNTLAAWCEELTHWKRSWPWERLKVGGEGDDRGWDGWMASLTRWTWVWVTRGSWWWTGRPGVLRFMGSQRVGHDWVTELNWNTVKLLFKVVELIYTPNNCLWEFHFFLHSYPHLIFFFLIFSL